MNKKIRLFGGKVMYNKKVISFVLFVGLLVQLFCTNVFSKISYAAETVSETDVEAKIESKIIGDVNGDGKRNSIDFAMMRMALLGMIDDFPISNPKWAYDADGNGVFNSIDFAYMRMLLLSIIKELPAESIVTPTAIITATPIVTPIVTPTVTASYKFNKVVGGFGFAIALNEDGTVWAWGNNYFNQLGNGSNIASSNPVKVNNLIV